jgi:hypothetical protein
MGLWGLTQAEAVVHGGGSRVDGQRDCHQNALASARIRTDDVFKNPIYDGSVEWRL